MATHTKVSGIGIKHQNATTTVEDTTLYVRTTGNDSNSGLTEGSALLTIQEAVDRVPKFIKHDITIDIGPGNFAGFALANFLLMRGRGTFLVKGTLGTPTLTGATSGTATGGDTLNVTDSGAGWAVNELRGKFMLVDGEYRLVRKNTATNAELIGPMSASCSGKDYEVLEHKTKLTSVNPYSSGLPAACYIAGNVCHRTNLTIQDIEATGTTLGFYNYVGFGVHYVRLAATSCAYGIGSQSTSGECTIEDCYVANASTFGFTLVEIGAQARISRIHDYGSDFAIFVGGPGSIPSAPCEYWYSDNSTDVGMYFFFFAEVYLENIFVENAAQTGICFTGCRHCRIKGSTIKNNGAAGIWIITSQVTLENTNDISSNGGYGIQLGDREPRAGDVLAGFSSLDVFSGTTTIATNTLGGIHAGYMSIVRLTDVDGTNTGDYGLILESGSYGFVTSDTGITGSIGDATINDGASSLDWTDDFATNGDMAVNIDNGCRLERKD
jgi:hypothetical protein